MLCCSASVAPGAATHTMAAATASAPFPPPPVDAPRASTRGRELRAQYERDGVVMIR